MTAKCNMVHWKILEQKKKDICEHKSLVANTNLQELYSSLQHRTLQEREFCKTDNQLS